MTKGLTNIKTDEDIAFELQYAYDNARFEIIQLNQHLVETKAQIIDYQRIKHRCKVRAEYLKIKLF